MENKLSLVKSWFNKADNDLMNSEMIFNAEADTKPYDTVCFHCQQAAEKYLKGFLLYLDIPFIKTHNIEVLMDLVSATHPDIDNYSAAASLTRYAVENRYPDDYIEIPEEEAKEAFAYAASVKAFVIDKVGSI